MVRFVKGQMICRLTNNLSFCQFPRPDQTGRMPLIIIYKLIQLILTFDSVPHGRLIKKLEGYGIRGNLLNWLKSFLKDRQRYSGNKINDVTV